MDYQTCCRNNLSQMVLQIVELSSTSVQSIAKGKRIVEKDRQPQGIWNVHVN